MLLTFSPIILIYRIVIFVLSLKIPELLTYFIIWTKMEHFCCRDLIHECLIIRLEQKPVGMLIYNILVASPIASRRGRGSRKNSLKPTQGIYKTALKRITLSDHQFFPIFSFRHKNLTSLYDRISFELQTIIVNFVILSLNSRTSR